jgi:hypothetical protein
MKTFAEIQEGVIVNVSAWENEMPKSDELVDITDIPNVGIGWLYTNGEFVEPEPVIPPPTGQIPVTEV